MSTHTTTIDIPATNSPASPPASPVLPRRHQPPPAVTTDMTPIDVSSPSSSPPPSPRGPPVAARSSKVPDAPRKVPRHRRNLLVRPGMPKCEANALRVIEQWRRRRITGAFPKLCRPVVNPIITPEDRNDPQNVHRRTVRSTLRRDRVVPLSRLIRDERERRLRLRQKFGPRAHAVYDLGSDLEKDDVSDSEEEVEHECDKDESQCVPCLDDDDSLHKDQVMDAEEVLQAHYVCPPAVLPLVCECAPMPETDVHPDEDDDANANTASVIRYLRPYGTNSLTLLARLTQIGANVVRELQTMARTRVQDDDADAVGFCERRALLRRLAGVPATEEADPILYAAVRDSVCPEDPTTVRQNERDLRALELVGVVFDERTGLPVGDLRHHDVLQPLHRIASSLDNSTDAEEDVVALLRIPCEDHHCNTMHSDGQQHTPLHIRAADEDSLRRLCPDLVPLSYEGLHRDVLSPHTLISEREQDQRSWALEQEAFAIAMSRAVGQRGRAIPLVDIANVGRTVVHSVHSVVRLQEE